MSKLGKLTSEASIGRICVEKAAGFQCKRKWFVILLLMPGYSLKNISGQLGLGRCVEFVARL